MTPAEAFDVVVRARARRVLQERHGFEVAVSAAAGAFFQYTVSVAPYRRNADGRLSRRLHGATARFGPAYDPGVLIIDAAQWLLDNYPEVAAQEQQPA